MAKGGATSQPSLYLVLLSGGLTGSPNGCILGTEYALVCEQHLLPHTGHAISRSGPTRLSGICDVPREGICCQSRGGARGL